VREDTDFVIPVERHLALDVYYHPFGYADHETREDGPLAGAIC
jgi:hypothetical protein